MIWGAKQICEVLNIFLIFAPVLGRSKHDARPLVLNRSKLDISLKTESWYGNRQETTSPSLDDCLCFPKFTSTMSSSSSSSSSSSLASLSSSATSETMSTRIVSLTTSSSTTDTMTTTTASAITSPPILWVELDSDPPLLCPPEGRTGTIQHNITFNPGGIGPTEFIWESPRYLSPDQSYPNSATADGYKCIYKFTSSDPSYKIRIILNANDFALPGIKPDDCEDDDHIFLDTVRTGVFMCGTYNRRRDFDSQANEMTATFFVNEKMRDKGFRLIVTAIPA